MIRDAATGRAARVAELVDEAEADASLLDLVDNLLNKGVVVSGDVVLGIAGIDLIYLRVSAILCAVDRILPGRPRSGGDKAAR